MLPRLEGCHPGRKIAVGYIKHHTVAAPHFVGPIVCAETDDGPQATCKTGDTGRRQADAQSSVNQFLQVSPHFFQGTVPLPNVLQ